MKAKILNIEFDYSHIMDLIDEDLAQLSTDRKCKYCYYNCNGTCKKDEKNNKVCENGIGEIYEL